jgi:hypothetical protein
MALVLCTGADPDVMKARQEFLTRAGHRVMSAMNEKELSAACKKYKFDVVVIGQSLSKNMKRHVVDLVREHCPDIRILEIYPTTSGRALEDADSWLETPGEVPQTVADRVEELAKAS